MKKIIGDNIIVRCAGEGKAAYINLPASQEFDWSKVKIAYRCIDENGVIRDEFGNAVPYVASLPDDSRGQPRRLSK